MQRRRFLQQTGTVALGSLALSGVVAGREEGEAPNDNVDTEWVSIFAPEDDPRQVSTGTWIEHRWGWVDIEGGDSTRADVQRYLDAIELEMYIDGEALENPMQYWGDIRQRENGDYIVPWSYTTPPKQPGMHTLAQHVSFPDGFEDTDGDGEHDPSDLDIPVGWEGTNVGHYEVVPGGGNGKGSGAGKGNSNGRGGQ